MSWHRFHRELALSGRQPKHFAYVNREKYLSMIFDSYCDERHEYLNYGHYLRRALGVLGSEDVLIVDMDNLSSKLPKVNRWAKGLGIHLDGDPTTPYRNKNRGAEIDKAEIFSQHNLNRLEEYRRDIESLRWILPAGWQWL